MDARIARLPLIFCVLFICTGASHKTRNFTVHASNRSIAEKVGQAAEHWRAKLARQWTGRVLPPWSKPCPIKVKVGQIGAGGATRFSFDKGHVFNWNMNVQGSLERIIDSVIPHEVNHTILACHFRRPIPRWADEGAATLCEHESERHRQLMLLQDILNEKRRIPLRQLLQIKEYPKQMDKVLTLYAQGYSLADFLVQQQGKQTFLKFLDDAHTHGWEHAIRQNYRHDNVESLERQWSGWFMAGSPRLDLHRGTMLALNKSDGAEVEASVSKSARTSRERESARPSAKIRSQSPARNPQANTLARSRSTANNSAGLYGNNRQVRAPRPFNTPSVGGHTNAVRWPAATVRSSRASTTSSQTNPFNFTGSYEFQKPVLPEALDSFHSCVPFWLWTKLRVSIDAGLNDKSESGMATPVPSSP